MAVSGTIPYLLTGTFTDFASSFFEAMSGYTTTGASVLNDIEVLPKGVLFGEVLHWIGGMGIIVCSAILPFLGIGVFNCLQLRHLAWKVINCIRE